MARQINQAGLDLIKNFEGFKAKPYWDVTAHATVGYGTTFYEDGTPVKISDPVITEERASELMLNKLNSEFCPGIEKLIKVTITDNQFAALVALAYNIGLGNFKQSTVLRCTNAKNWDDAARSFLLWDKSGGITLPGLLRRRQAESDLFRTP